MSLFNDDIESAVNRIRLRDLSWSWRRDPQLAALCDVVKTATRVAEDWNIAHTQEDVDGGHLDDLLEALTRLAKARSP